MVRKDLDLENIHLHVLDATQHVLKFQGINALSACPRAGQCLKGQRSYLIYPGLGGPLFPTDKI